MQVKRILPLDKAPTSLLDLKRSPQVHPIVYHFSPPFSLESILRYGVISAEEAGRRRIPFLQEWGRTPESVRAWRGSEDEQLVVKLPTGSTWPTIFAKAAGKIEGGTMSNEVVLDKLEPHRIFALAIDARSASKAKLVLGSRSVVPKEDYARVVISGAGGWPKFSFRIVQRTNRYIEKLTGKKLPEITVFDFVLAMSKKHGLPLYDNNLERIWP